jgi:CRP-like cAMP-binding protein/CheY-like chemotaxis protein
MNQILLLDNQPSGGTNTRELLALSNFQVLTARIPTKAGEIELKGSPDLVICDLADSLVDIEVTLAALQRQPILNKVPLIVFTNNADKSNTRRIMDLGADDYLVKPFEGIELLRAVDACLERQRRRLHPAHLPATDRPPATSDALSWRPANGEVAHFGKKEILYTEGHRASQAWYIVEGKIKTYLLHPDGKELITAIHGPGECVGYTAVLSRGAYTDNAQAIENSRLIGIPGQEFLSILQSDSTFARQLIHWIAQNAGEKEAGLLNFAYSSLRKKVANGILQLAGSPGRKQKGKRYVSISRDNLAAFVGSAPESLIRTLGDFRKEGLIEIADGRICLLNEEKLRNMLN